MNKYLIIFLTLLFIVFSCKNNNDDVSNAVLSKEYFGLINKAEVLISCNNFEKALENYEKAFSLTDNTFALDLHNYLILTIELGKINKAKNAIKKLISNKGITLDYLKKRREFKKVRDNSILWSYIENNYSKFHNLFLKTANIPLRNRLKRILEADQKVRHSIPRGVNQYLYPEILKVDSLNMLEVMKIFNKYGYPTLNLTGVNEKNADFMDDFLDKVILHNFGDLRFDKKLMSFLKNNNEKLKIRNDQLFRWMYYYHSHNDSIFDNIPPGGFPITIVDGTEYYTDYSNGAINKLDSLYQNYNLLPYKDELCLIIYQWRKKGFVFSTHNTVVKYNMKYPEQGKNLIRDFNLKPVDNFICHCD